jgi:hypothetical protein
MAFSMQILAGLVCLASSAIAWAQVPEQPASPWGVEARTHWTIAFEPRLWYAGPSGDFRFPGGSATNDKIDLDELSIDDPVASPYGELRLQRGPWRIVVSGSATDADATSTIDTTRVLGSVAVFSGERARLDFSHASFEAQALYRLGHYVDGKTAQGRDIVRFAMFAGLGMRFTNIDLDFAVTPTSIARVGGEVTALSYEHTFVEPMIAASAELLVYEKFSLGVEGTFGFFESGDVSSASASIEPTFGWFPVDNLGIEIGYRMLIHRMEDGQDPSQFEWSGSMAGLFAGVSLRF